MRKRIFFLSLSLLFCPAPAIHAAPLTAPVSMTFHEKDGHFDIQAHLRLEADPATAWEVLTDYENYPKLSHELKKVMVTERSPKHMVVEEMAESGFLFITQKVFFHLEVHLVPGRSITAVDTGHKSFVSYQNRWDVHPGKDPKTVELVYHLQAEGHFGGPAFMVNEHFQGGVRNFLEALRKEILKRQSLKDHQTPDR